MGTTMKMGVGAVVIATAGFLAGQAADWRTSAASAATLMQDGQPEMSPEVTAQMEAMMQAGTPGEHHAILNSFVGHWEGVYQWRPAPDAEMIPMTGSVERKWILDGRFIEEHVDSQSPWGPFQGRGFLGYDNVDGQYIMCWMDTTTTGFYQEQGVYNSKTKTMKMWSSHRDPASGHLVRMRSELDLSNPNRHTMRGWQTDASGVEFEAFKGVFEKVSAGHDHSHEHGHGHDHDH